MVGNLNGLGGSILASFRRVDLLFPLSTLVLLLLYIFFFNKRILPGSFRTRILSGSILLIISVFTIGLNLYIARNDVSNLLSEENEFRYDLIDGTSTYGFFHCWVYQFKSLMITNQSMTSAEKVTIGQWMKQHKTEEKFVKKNKATKKNVILLIVESLESFPIGNKLNGTEITPNLNRLLKDGKCLYAPHVVPQVNSGHSSDAQLIFNAGMLPPHIGAACFRYARNRYFTLAKALHKKGYNTHTLVGGNASFWNQGVLTKQLGYDDLISIDNFNCDESYDFGLTDSSFLAQSAARLTGFKQPFLAQMITLSSHDPYRLINNRIYLKAPADCPPDLAAYLNAIHYVDKSIGEFVAELRKNGLLEKSILIITGDHDATKYQAAQWKQYAGQWKAQTALTPFIVVNGIERKIYTPIMGQIDIYPTLIDMLGLKNYAWHGLGLSILSPDKVPYAVNAHLHEFGSVRSVSAKAVRQIKSAWKVSDLMVCKSYFGKE
jgi:phosphoglycerol transferase MdoB-like AlkP superfamily enzyme